MPWWAEVDVMMGREKATKLTPNKLREPVRDVVQGIHRRWPEPKDTLAVWGTEIRTGHPIPEGLPIVRKLISNLPSAHPLCTLLHLAYGSGWTNFPVDVRKLWFITPDGKTTQEIDERVLDSGSEEDADGVEGVV